MLVAVIFMLAMFILAMAVAAPKVAKEIQRDREIETMHRGKQYIRAIQLYYRKFGAYPPNLDALVKTTEIRFLRKKYVDPTTGKPEWKPILVGQNKTPVMGFFGQPLAGAGTALGGVGPGGVAGASPMGNPNGSLFPSTDSGSGTSTTGSTDPNAAAAGSADTGTAGAASSAPSTAGGSVPGTSGLGGLPGSSGTGAGGVGGQTFGGAGIMGVSPMSPKQSILVYKKKNHYNEWEFFYSPLSEQMMSGGNAGAGIGQPASNLNGTPGSGTPSIGGFGGSGSSFGGSSGFGSSPTQSPSSSPQQ